MGHAKTIGYTTLLTASLSVQAHFHVHPWLSLFIPVR